MGADRLKKKAEIKGSAGDFGNFETADRWAPKVEKATKLALARSGVRFKMVGAGGFGSGDFFNILLDFSYGYVKSHSGTFFFSLFTDVIFSVVLIIQLFKAIRVALRWCSFYCLAVKRHVFSSPSLLLNRFLFLSQTPCLSGVK